MEATTSAQHLLDHRSVHDLCHNRNECMSHQQGWFFFKHVRVIFCTHLKPQGTPSFINATRSAMFSTQTQCAFCDSQLVTSTQFLVVSIDQTLKRDLPNQDLNDNGNFGTSLIRIPMETSLWDLHNQDLNGNLSMGPP